MGNPDLFNWGSPALHPSSPGPVENYSIYEAGRLPSTERPSCYRPQRSCGQGNVFTGVCLSTGGGVCLSACWDARPPQTRQTPPDQADPPRTRQTPPGPGRHPPPRLGRPPQLGRPPRDQADPSPRTRQTPPGKQTPAYGLRAAGTHPTGIHSCLVVSVNTFIIIQKSIPGII